MPRRLSILLIALTLGIITNTLIALILAWRPAGVPVNQAFGFDLGNPRDAPTQFSMQWSGHFGRDSVTVSYVGGVYSPTTSIQQIKSRFTQIFAPDPASDFGRSIPDFDTWSARFFQPHTQWALSANPSDRTRRTFSTGFPFRSLCGHQSLNLSVGAVTSNRGTLRDDPFDASRAISVIPIPFGFAAGALLYSLPWLALLLLWPGLRNRRRRRRGHCPRCNYDLRRDLPSGCPECGWNRAALAKT